ncbi:N(G),N(G)-dimethylarginine dimethylaminohydrolase 2 [Bombina bombina]|uniref:N(G),N(G)-dimethylarginine dimethylaminohydrolase 2 n=1 Tax=Bombina bombina TaxID=8345 RepID=UPI00235AB66A|nr:N(G),N(G)-dimethylarginine dimethylaminohydrolase 2 [Bombina bombina]XP_053578054.1 N(G),N(G)-dimethylarginine dimethylaminohydrolase 2 [Bombina bombina]XP_053578055.1 N(G),N(G)-dimethylarginine dimethylaminohydrolase 2 [Bombina bombina]XP_053578056.1 N(G),N(G)-dimethylarginine dimethylaminohydrolase 2 [Bombina bombina]
MSGRYTHAVVRGVPTSFGLEADGKVDLARAQRESGVYCGILRQKLGLQVVELPPDEDLPKGQLTGDIAVAIADTALITSPYIPSRRKEIEGFQKLFEELKFRVCQLTDENATLDASDILFTGREIFVGLSKWTNLRGAEFVAKTYQDYAVSTVPVSGDLHLKSFCSMGGPDTLIIGSSDTARKALKFMEQLTDHHYETLTVPDDPAANCIYARVGPKLNVLVHRSAEEYPNSVQVFQKLTDYTLVPAACSEVSKIGGCLTSCSILINRKLEI